MVRWVGAWGWTRPSRTVWDVARWLMVVVELDLEVEEKEDWIPSHAFILPPPISCNRRSFKKPIKFKIVFRILWLWYERNADSRVGVGLRSFQEIQPPHFLFANFALVFLFSEFFLFLFPLQNKNPRSRFYYCYIPSLLHQIPSLACRVHRIRQTFLFGKWGKI